MRKNAYFKPINIKVDFPVLEKQVLEDWQKSGLVKKYLRKNSNLKKRFSFLDGPITANNPMGVHHAWGRTYKDIWQRYYNLKGFAQRFQNGFDCQGLWVEVEVEKELGLKSKRDIENLVEGDKTASIAKFVNLCKERVNRFADIQTQQSKRLGYFMDWENSYYTLSDENNYMIWHFLKKCSEMGLIYKGRDSVPWCPRCGTAISQHEILTEDYKEATHDSIYMEYPIKGKDNEYLLVWTTTPWTLPGNVAIAVDANANYVVATGEVAGNKYILNEFAARKLGLKIEEKIPGKNIVGLKYTSPFDDLPGVKKSLSGYEHEVVATDSQILPVSEEEGTGMVHVAPGAGTEDFQLGKKLGLPVIALIDEEASYISDLDGFSGKNAKKHPEIIIDFLREKDSGRFLFDVVSYTHRYPACWRCKTELVWRVVDEWYIAMDKYIGNSKKTLRKRMVRVAKKIKWIPEFGLDRELDWLKNMHDWLISKKRYWGLALPIWECSNCGHFEVIGSYDELEKEAVSGWKNFVGNSPHRPWVDEVKIKCKKCGESVSRIPDVGNPWLDAGIVPYSTITKGNSGKPLYLADNKEWQRWFPADFITESFPGQFKNWFYSMIAESTVLENTQPYNTVLGFATLLAEDGRAMHKSLGNAIEFNEGADKIGVDVMRWMYARQNPEDNLLFGYTKADETRRRFHLKLWNIYNFFVTYANVDGYVPTEAKNLKLNTQNVLDKWMLSRLIEVEKKSAAYLDKYDAFRASEVIETFVDDFSNWYVRRSRDRVGPTSEDGGDKKLFYETTFFVLINLCRILSPFIPFISDVIYTNLTKEESVHLSFWPTFERKEDSKLIAQMLAIREVVETVHGIRKEENIPVRQPLQSLTVKSPTPSPDKKILELLLAEVNVKEIKWVEAAKLEVKLDKKITKLLEEEGKARELVRKIQSERRNMGIELTQKITVSSPWIPTNKNILQWVSKKTLANNLVEGEFKILKTS